MYIVIHLTQLRSNCRLNNNPRFDELANTIAQLRVLSGGLRHGQWSRGLRHGHVVYGIVSDAVLTLSCDARVKSGGMETRG